LLKHSTKEKLKPGKSSTASCQPTVACEGLASLQISSVGGHYLRQGTWTWPCLHEDMS
jgi:hypothetical protein